MGHTELIEFNWTLVMILINILILYAIMKHFFFEKIHNFMLARQNVVSEAFENAERTNLLADQKLAQYNSQIADIESEGRKIIKSGKIKAEIRAKEILEDANKKAEDLLLQTEREIELEKHKAVNEIKEQIASIAILAAEKILEKQLEGTGQDEIIDKIIEEAGTTIWKK